MGRWVIAGVAALVVAVVAGIGFGLFARPAPVRTPSCTSSGPDASPLDVDQADSAATIAGVGLAMGMPAHAVTVALATAMQESGLRNLTGGDRDSAGLFQQRPSQGWGTYAQVTNPVHAASAFYAKLKTEPGWQTLTVTQAAQLVQRSAAPDAYAQWEPAARDLATALTGNDAAGLSCRDLTPTVPGADVAALADAELGTARLSGTQPAIRGWAIGSWLVAHATRLGLESVTYDGRTWTVQTGQWLVTGPGDGRLSLGRAPSGASPASGSG